LPLAALFSGTAAHADEQDTSWANDSVRTVRIAVLVGNNRGAEGSHYLRYAENDVGKMKNVLVSVCGFERRNIHVLLGERKETLEKAMEEVTARVEEEVGRDMKVFLLFYYSGHSKNGMMELATTKKKLAEVRDWLIDSSATFKMAIVDSCDSARILNPKGPEGGDPSDEEFSIEPPPVPDDIDFKGSALVVSSSRGERSYEGSKIDASIFTHHWVSGLLGAADLNDDGEVALSEVCEYARKWTLHDTGKRQTPCWNNVVTGSGRVVLTRPWGGPVVNFGNTFTGKVYLQ